MDITKLTVHELQEKLEKKELTVTQIVQAYANRIEEKEEKVQAFLSINTEEALEEAKKIVRRKKYITSRNTYWN